MTLSMEKHWKMLCERNRSSPLGKPNRHEPWTATQKSGILGMKNRLRTFIAVLLSPSVLAGIKKTVRTLQTHFLDVRWVYHNREQNARFSLWTLCPLCPLCQCIAFNHMSLSFTTWWPLGTWFFFTTCYDKMQPHEAILKETYVPLLLNVACHACLPTRHHCRNI